MKLLKAKIFNFLGKHVRKRDLYLESLTTLHTFPDWTRSTIRGGGEKGERFKPLNSQLFVVVNWVLRRVPIAQYLATITSTIKSKLFDIIALAIVVKYSSSALSNVLSHCVIVVINIVWHQFNRLFDILSCSWARVDEFFFWNFFL